MDWSNCSSQGVPTLSCVPAVVMVIITLALSFAGIIALFLIIISGIRFINSGGDSKSVDGAKKTMTHAIVGLILILMSFFIVNFIAYFTHVSCITSFGFNSCPAH